MTTSETLPTAVPVPFRQAPDAAALRPAPATLALVHSQVQALLESAPAYHQLPRSDQRRLFEQMKKIAAYAAECVRDDWLQSERLGQRPLVRYRERLQGPVARAQDDFSPSATSQVARVTQDTLKAIAFPTFVADLIKGTFEAITNSSIQQMEAYLKLLENVGQTVDQFMNSNISDDQARDWLAQRYPDHIQVSGRKAGPRPTAEDHPPPDFQADLNLTESPSLDEDGIESTLVPAARRRLAENRLQLLSTLVLMGINRIVVTGGKIRASMLFHIDASDRLRQEHATDMDFRAAASGSYGFGPWSVSASVSFAYVSSSRSTSESDLNVSADLTGEVEIHFKSDYFPLQRFAPPGTIAKIQGNTAVPEENVPWTPNATAPPPRPQESLAPSRPIGSPLPAAPAPAAPVAPVVTRRTESATPGTTTPPTRQPAASQTPAAQQPASPQPATAASPAQQPAAPQPAPAAAPAQQPAAAPAPAQQPAPAAAPAPQPAPAAGPVQQPTSPQQPVPAGAH